MITRSQFYRLALEANEGQINDGDDVLPIPTVDERVTLYLRAVHGEREFTKKERWSARDILLNSMAAAIAVRPAKQSPNPGRQPTCWADLLAQYSSHKDSAPEQSRERETTGALPLHPYKAAAQYWPSVERKETIRVAPRRLTRTLGLTATLGLALIVTGGYSIRCNGLIVTLLDSNRCNRITAFHQSQGGQAYGADTTDPRVPKRNRACRNAHGAVDGAAAGCSH